MILHRNFDVFLALISRMDNEDNEKIEAWEKMVKEERSNNSMTTRKDEQEEKNEEWMRRVEGASGYDEDVDYIDVEK